MSAKFNKECLSTSMDSPDIQVKDIRIDVPWGHLAGRWYGNRKIRPILALHGWLDNLGTWAKLIPLLPKHIGVLCIDLPGHGHSSKYPPEVIYHTLDFIDVIIRVMKEYKWQKVSLLAHSLGSIVSFLFTSIYPHRVDMLIAIDLIYPSYPSYVSREIGVKILRQNIEKNMVISELQSKLDNDEPPSYTYGELERMLYEGSGHSLELENCKYILDRSIRMSTKYPKKYYFNRDAKLKYYTKYQAETSLFHEMAKNIKNVPYLIIKGNQSPFIDLEEQQKILEVLCRSNSHFEFYQVDGTHHVHLNNASEVAAILKPFINRYRPAPLNEWSSNDECDDYDDSIGNGNFTNKVPAFGDEVGKSKL